MKRNIILANGNFKYYVIEGEKLIFTTKNIKKLKEFIKNAYHKELSELKFDNSILEKMEKQEF